MRKQPVFSKRVVTRSAFSLSAIAAAGLIAFACDYRYDKVPMSREGAPISERPSELKFATVNDHVFGPKCSTCHNSSTDFDIRDHKIASGLKDTIAQRVSANGRGQMPPAGAPQLTNEEKALVTEWIQAGAPK